MELLLRTTRLAAVLAGSATTVLLLASPVFAHVTLDKSSLPADSDQSLQARVPGENPPAYNIKLILEIPAGFTAKTCADKVGWTCKITADTSNGRSALITWTRQSGVDAIDLFDFTVHTPNKNGSYKFDANQFYSDGSKVFWDGPPDSDHPAPRIEVTGANTPPVKNSAPPPTHSSSAGTASTPAPRPTASATAISAPAVAEPLASLTPRASAGPVAPTRSAAPSTDPTMPGTEPTQAAAIEAAQVQDAEGLPAWVVVLALAALAVASGALVWRRRARG